MTLHITLHYIDPYQSYEDLTADLYIFRSDAAQWKQHLTSGAHITEGD